jgi:hypothetical protein
MSAELSRRLDEAVVARVKLRKRRAELQASVVIAERLAAAERASRIRGEKAAGSEEQHDPLDEQQYGHQQGQRRRQQRAHTVQGAPEMPHRPRNTHGLPGLSYYASYVDCQRRLRASLARIAARHAYLRGHEAHQLRKLAAGFRQVPCGPGYTYISRLFFTVPYWSVIDFFFSSHPGTFPLPSLILT